jgi:hypothetical protein
MTRSAAGAKGQPYATVGRPGVDVLTGPGCSLPGKNPHLTCDALMPIPAGVRAFTYTTALNLVICWICSFVHIDNSRFEMAADCTVRVEPMEGWPAIKMTWCAQVNSNDVHRAFEAICEHVFTAVRPVYVVVDITASPNFPIFETVVGALPVFKDPKLAAWLIVGSNSGAKAVEGLLSRVTGRSNVQWFDAESDALDYLAAMEKQAANL